MNFYENFSNSTRNVIKNGDLDMAIFLVETSEKMNKYYLPVMHLIEFHNRLCDDVIKANWFPHRTFKNKIFSFVERRLNGNNLFFFFISFLQDTLR